MSSSGGTPEPQRLVFRHTMEALLERCAKDLPAPGWAELLRLGVDREKLLPAYEYERWCEVVAYLAGQLHPSRALGDAEFQLGTDFIERYAETLIGRALFAVLRVLGPRRILGRMARSFRTGTNYTETSLSEETERGALLRISNVEPRGRFTHGLLSRGLQLAGIATVRVDLEQVNADGASYRVSW